MKKFRYQVVFSTNDCDNVIVFSGTTNDSVKAIIDSLLSKSYLKSLTLTHVSFEPLKPVDSCQEKEDQKATSE